MDADVVISGVGMVTPLGNHPESVLDAIAAGKRAAAPTPFDSSPFGCRVCARVTDFDPGPHVREPKLLRLMNRDAQLAMVAARLALADARFEVGVDGTPEDVGLFGATGLAGLTLSEVTPLLRASVDAAGRFDPRRFGEAGLKAISPLLSFKVLGNLPVCFVSICERVQGPNAIYTPWEGQGARAIEAGWLAVRRGEVRCALVGGTDVKCHELAFISLEQLGVFRAWTEGGRGPVPGEGAAFLLLESAEGVRRRGGRPLARLERACFGSAAADGDVAGVRATLRRAMAGSPVDAVVGGDEASGAAFDGKAASGRSCVRVLQPKAHVGNLFAAAAAVQVGLGAVFSARDSGGGRVEVECFGQGSEQAVFRLTRP